MANAATQTRHNRILQLAALWLCLLGLLCGCAEEGAPAPGVSRPGGGAVTPTGASQSDVTMAYTANDSLNPYLALTRTNQELSRLLYDGLITLGADCEPIYRLARTAERAGSTVTVSLREAYFTDGSRITAADVIASFEAARKAESLSYKADFANVSGVSATESGGVRFTLSHEDPYFVNFLDFPIYKAGSEDRQNDDNKTLPPVGGGRYEFHEAAGDYWLTANQNWFGGDVLLPRIELLNLPDDDATQHAIQVGTVDYYYSDLSDNVFPAMNGVSVTVPLPNLVYLGANDAAGFAALRAVRLGISAALDRSQIADSAYFDMATPAAGPYPAAWQAAAGLQTISPKADLEEAAKQFEAAGFTTPAGGGTRQSGGYPLALRLIYNKENTARESLARLLVTQLGAAGCKVEAQGLSFAQYQKAVQNGQFDLYIGEMRLPDNLDLYPLLTAGGLRSPDVSEQPAPEETNDGGGAATGGGSAGGVSLSAARAAYRYHNGQGSFSEMLSCFGEQLPVIPLCHRSGMLIYADFLSGSPAPLADDPYFGLESCTVQTGDTDKNG